MLKKIQKLPKEKRNKIQIIITVILAILFLGAGFLIMQLEIFKMSYSWF